MPECFFAPFDPEIGCEFRYDGQPDRCHLVPKQRLKREGIEDYNGQAWWVPGCRRHHIRFDGHFFRVPRSEIPEDTERAAVEVGLEWSLARDYGPLTPEAA